MSGAGQNSGLLSLSVGWLPQTHGKGEREEGEKKGKKDKEQGRD